MDIVTAVMAGKPEDRFERSPIFPTFSVRYTTPSVPCGSVDRRLQRLRFIKPVLGTGGAPPNSEVCVAITQTLCWYNTNLTVLLTLLAIAVNQTTNLPKHVKTEPLRQIQIPDLWLLSLA